MWLVYVLMLIISSLSPLLFAMYISEMGEDIAIATDGFAVAGKIINGLFLADDLVLVSRTAEGLKSLLALVKFHCDKLRMTVSQTKSQVISPTDEEWSLTDTSGNVTLSLEQVAEYKYLGLDMYGSMFRTGVMKQKKAIATALKYKGCCLKVSRMGPDQAQLGLSCWNNIACPSILFGTETIPFSESTIVTMDRTQSQLTKALLGLPLSAPNISANTDLSMKTFRHRLYEKALKFYWRLLNLPSERWSHRALREHMDGGWDSKYVSFILRIREEVGLLAIPPSQALLSHHLDVYFLQVVNATICSLELPALAMMTTFKNEVVISESEDLQVCRQFKYFASEIGRRVPRLGYERMIFCPLCELRVGQIPLTEVHLFVCSSLVDARAKLGISTFFNLGLLRGLSISIVFSLFVNGLDMSGEKISLSEFISRGVVLGELVKMFLNQW